MSYQDRSKMRTIYVQRGGVWNVLLGTLLFGIFQCSAYEQATWIAGMRTEYLTTPLGVDHHAPRFTWRMDDSRIGAAQTGFEIMVATTPELLDAKNPDMWHSGKIASNRSLTVYEGLPLKPFTRYYWSVRIWDHTGRATSEAKTSWFETGWMGTAPLVGHWITDTRDIHHRPAGYFRRDFDEEKQVVSARVYIAAAGYYELFLNGERTGDHYLDPVKTRYDRRVTYVAHDVTHQIKQGDNTIGVVLGNGWYNHQSTAVWFFHEVPWRARPSFWAELHLHYEDGSTRRVGTDQNWRTANGEIIFNSIYTAEHIDGRERQHGWNEHGFDDSQWGHVTVVSTPAPKMTHQSMHPVRITGVYEPRSMRQVDQSTYVFDLGQNISGVSRLKVTGERGTRMRLIHGERLNNQGRVDQSNIDMHYRPVDDSDPFQTDIFILSGQEDEVFMPRFNYKGFQFVEVQADRPVALNRESLTGQFMHSDVPPAGSLRSSNPIIEQIWQAGNYSYLANLFGYPTDCPQREKLGWTGDGHIAMETGLYNFDGITIYEKWMADHRDEQQPNGVLPAIIPSSGWGYHWANGVDWTSSVALVPWYIYLYYGDTRPLEMNYEAIKRYVNHIQFHYPNGLTDWGLGDWVPVNSRANTELTTTVYYYVVVSILAEASRLLDRPEDHTNHVRLAGQIYEAFNEAFFDEQTGLYGSGYQTELSMPLYWGLVPEQHRSRVAALLAERVRDNDHAIDTGLLGSKAILNALSENGFYEEAYRMASREAYPSWGWWMVNGATTFLENWSMDADSDISMNHIMFGEISAWFFKTLGGIRPDLAHPGFERVLLSPRFPEGLAHFEARFQSVRGEILSSWKRDGDRVELEVKVPANSEALLDPGAGWFVRSMEVAGGENTALQATQGRRAEGVLPAGHWLIVLEKHRHELEV